MGDKDKAADCPWCGPMRGHYGYTVGRFGTRLTCFCCDSHGPIAPTQDAALDAWNRRADIAAAIREAALREAAYVAINACLVPPDGGSPTEAERLVCEEAYRRILALIGEKK